jgi:hypothetical protein
MYNPLRNALYHLIESFFYFFLEIFFLADVEVFVFFAVFFLGEGVFGVVGVVHLP